MSSHRPIARTAWVLKPGVGSRLPDKYDNFAGLSSVHRIWILNVFKSEQTSVRCGENLKKSDKSGFKIIFFFDDIIIEKCRKLAYSKLVSY